jgi:pimeloyl-ACP methyl ester carboxylesterase
VISGDQDGTPGKLAALAARLQSGEYIEISDTGHYVPLERPATLAAILRDRINA